MVKTNATITNRSSLGSNCPKANYLYKKRHKAFCGTAKEAKRNKRERESRESGHSREGEMDIEEQWVQQTRDLFTKCAKTSAKITSVGIEKKREEREREREE